MSTDDALLVKKLNTAKNRLVPSRSGKTSEQVADINARIAHINVLLVNIRAKYSLLASVDKLIDAATKAIESDKNRDH
jgi:hypothetical protein